MRDLPIFVSAIATKLQEKTTQTGEPMKAKVLARTMDITEEEWHQIRRMGIGGSDIAAIAGVSDYKNALGVYLDKIGSTTPVEETEAMYFGKVLEPVVAKEFSKRSGKKVQRLNAVIQNQDHPFMLANLDRLVLDPDRGRGVLECKTSGQIARKWRESDLPASYVVQTQWYLGVTGLKYAWVAILLSGQKFLYELLERDDEMIGYLIEIGAAFWHMVENRNPPAIDGSDNCTELLQILWNNPQPTEIILPEEDAMKWITQYNGATTAEKVAAELKREAQNHLENMMGDNMTAHCGPFSLSWKPVSTTRCDTKLLKEEQPTIYEQYAKTTTSRRFNLKLPKE